MLDLMQKRGELSKQSLLQVHRCLALKCGIDFNYPVQTIGLGAMHHRIEAPIGGWASMPVFYNLPIAADGRPADVNRLLKLSIPHNIDSGWQLRIENEDITKSNNYIAHIYSSDEIGVPG
jgi:hypothetical protein